MSNHAAALDSSYPSCPSGKSVVAWQVPWRGLLPLILALLASGLLLGGSILPLWQMRLEAPQYQGDEALKVSVLPGAFHGDLAELAVLNQYIGVHVPETLPQFKWMPKLLSAGAVLGLLAGCLRGRNRRIGLLLVTCGLSIGLGFALLQAKSQIYDIGHKRDQKTVLVGVHDFTPPLLGSSKIAQFHVSSRLGSGAWMIGAALMLQVGAAQLSRRTIQHS